MISPCIWETEIQKQGDKINQPTVEHNKMCAAYLKYIGRLWKQLQNDYLTDFRERHKNINHRAKRKIKVGELVSISDENL